MLPEMLAVSGESHPAISGMAFFSEYNILIILMATVFFIYSNTLDSPLPTRPVANISFALNYYFHRYQLLGYHLANIVIHAATGVFLYLLTRLTLNLPVLRSGYESLRWVPLFTALIWLVHPLQTQSVTYIVQRMNSMAAMFYVLALLLYAKARTADDIKKMWTLFAGSILSGILALGTKEIAATLPLFILLYEWYFHQDLSLSWLKRHILPIVGVLIVLAIIALMYMGGHPLERLLDSYASRDFTLIQRVLTEFRVVVFYISLLLLPHPSRLNLDHEFLLSGSLIDPISTGLSLVTLAGLAALAIYLARRERLLSFCILWYLGNLLIESSVIWLEIIFEHRNYLPSMLVSLMAVSLIRRFIRPEWLGIGALGVIVLFFSVWTYERNNIWQSEMTLWGDCVKKSPNKARPHNNLAVVLSDRGNDDAAIAYYTEALRLNPRDSEVRRNLERLRRRMADSGKSS